MNDLFEVTLKKAHENPKNIYRLSIGFEGLTREQALFAAVGVAKILGLEFDMSYIIRGFREEVT